MALSSSHKLLYIVGLFASSNLVIASHVRQGKPTYLHDGHLRYGAAQPYVENTCGFPQWAVIEAGDPVPDRALVAGRDSHICDGTDCGKDMYVSMFNVEGGVAVGKTWFTRSDDSCASAALHVYTFPVTHYSTHSTTLSTFVLVCYFTSLVIPNF
jgi:hypothetical protein